ncbi:response regulator transcription factor [Paenibacillus senegalensis]|uniref:response regulator transcription factor n=1 Tax=Paenibacillus senegalensis TaxID=1465766 RepID=UPI000289C63B|nr:response regulator transcription factor [Paenibacillus senegalensis]
MNGEEILVIDHEEPYRQLIQFALLKHNYKVLLAENGAEGLKLYQEHRPNLVLLNTQLPDRNGFVIGRQLRRNLDTPIIYLSASAEPETIIRGFAAGADDFVTKPFDTGVLLARIGAVLRRSAMVSQPKKPLPETPDGNLLTHKEYNLLLLIEQGKSNREIANLMQLTEGTVKVYNNILYGKLGAKSRVQAITQAKKWGIIP